MIKLLNAAALASQPNPVTFEGRTVPDQPEWLHIINLSPYSFEVYDDASLLRTVVPGYCERIYKIRVHSEVFTLTAVSTFASKAVLPISAYALWMDLVNEDPEPVGVLVT